MRKENKCKSSRHCECRFTGTKQSVVYSLRPGLQCPDLSDYELAVTLPDGVVGAGISGTGLLYIA